MSELATIGVTKRFGGLLAVDAVSLTVPPGKITALIGPNGAGKTTLFNCITGVLEADAGRVLFDGNDITRLATHKRARAGIGRTFQRLEVFSGMSVFENLQVAAEATHPAKTLTGAFRLRHRTEPEIIDKVQAVLERLGIQQYARRSAADLPTGSLRLLELGRALCTEPRLLLLDELASGLDDRETENLARILNSIADEGVGILLIEHDIELVMEISHHVYVLDFGRLLAEGPPAAIAHDPQVRAAYLGSAAPVQAN